MVKKLKDPRGKARIDVAKAQEMAKLIIEEWKDEQN